MRDTDTLHRIDPAIVKKQVVAAGFEFVAEYRQIETLRQIEGVVLIKSALPRTPDTLSLRVVRDHIVTNARLLRQVGSGGMVVFDPRYF